MSNIFSHIKIFLDFLQEFNKIPKIVCRMVCIYANRCFWKSGNTKHRALEQCLVWKTFEGGRQE